MKTTKSIVIVLLVALLPVNLKSSCLCSKNMVTFLPYANRSKDGIVALVKIVRQNVFDQGPCENLPFLDPFPINYLEVKVLKNLGSNKIGDTINILIPGEVECCLLYPRIGIQGDTAVIHAFELNESDYGYNNNEFKAYCLTTCMISSLSVKNGFVIGPITRKKEQRIPIDQFIRKF